MFWARNLERHVSQLVVHEWSCLCYSCPNHLIQSVPYLHHTEERGHPDPIFKWRSRYWNFLLKLDPKRPSPVIQARPGPCVGPFHWNNRRLRVAEIKRLFSFPDDFDFVGSRSSVQAPLGTSVPRLLRDM
jgi:DNA (cytosine-5)-methyltransferase 1